MATHLVMFGNAAAARNGLTAMPVDSNEDYFKISSTNYLVNNSGKMLYIIGAQVITAAIANLTAWRFHLTHEANWNTFTTQFGRDQTGAKTVGSIARLCKEFPDKTMLAAELNNNNNSQVDVILFWISDNPKGEVNFSPDQHEIPAGYEWRKFTHATTVTAAVMTDCALNAVDFYPDDQSEYHVAGLQSIGATNIACRLKHKEGGTQGLRMGGTGGDIATPDTGNPTYGDFGKFKGDAYPIAQSKNVAADTSGIILLLCKKCN